MIKLYSDSKTQFPSSYPYDMLSLRNKITQAALRNRDY